MKTLIKGGTIYTAVDSYTADVLVEGGVISQIGADLSAIKVDKTIDATGKYVRTSR